MNSRLLLVLSFVLIRRPRSEAHTLAAWTSCSRLFLQSPPAARSEHFGFLMDGIIVVQTFLPLSRYSSVSFCLQFLHFPPLQLLSFSPTHAHSAAHSVQAAAVNKRSCHCAFDGGFVLFVRSEPGTNCI